ncbi:hypothetical protein [Bradyrhizobium sp. CCBAU 53415]|uniref:hypothetical protein n=1 Tax=Bradyrhizobium sp. CCBAU 53415 TaxID=1325119 RepID=UPI002304E2DB|nr:hypothetical protein [Bradyrhizobium sp. CCBAU 53415]MDA9465342.1 hypothetical protein [Bradyrhizobium sp. CCBAU 53415]
MANATIILKNPIEGPVTDPTSGESRISQIKEIVLREPKYRDVMLLGEPASLARSEGGMLYQAEKDDVVQAYIERLMVVPQDRALLEQVSLADALQLKEAVFGFFQAARKAITPPAAPPA